MNAFEIAGGVVLIIACVVITLVVMMQESKAKGMGAVMGADGGDAGYGKGRAKTKDALLNRITKISAILFFAISLAVCIISVYVK